MKGKHQHREAFCLMTYRSDDESEEELIWNSRDGVTPFSLTLRSGKSARHVDWQNDAYAPYRTPQPGERIFVDLSPARAREAATRRVDQFPEFLPAGTTREQMIESLVQGFLEPPGQPDLIEVAG